MENQTPITNLQRNVQQLEERINNQILGVKGLKVIQKEKKGAKWRTDDRGV